jgi:outer membrane usher protein FimD/PapC
MQLGGIGFYRAYGMDPSLITTPTARFIGTTPVAGEVEVYVDGIRVYTAPVKPGSFELDNITRYAGLRHVEVLVRDPSGQVIQRSSSTTYLSDRDWRPLAGMLAERLAKLDPASAAIAMMAWASPPRIGSA